MRTLLTAGLLALSSAVLLLAQDSAKRSGEEGRLVALESAWNRAELSKDAAALNQLLGESLVYVDYDGALFSKKEFLQNINNDGMTVHVYGNAAVVTGVYRDKGIEKGKAFSRHGRFTDTWVNQNGVWQCVASQSTLIAH